MTYGLYKTVFLRGGWGRGFRVGAYSRVALIKQFGLLGWTLIGLLEGRCLLE